jgi:hypothetical protein
MALSNEDHKDIKTHLGKALANKVSKVTDDSKMKRKMYPEGGLGKDKTESYSNIRRSVTNYRPEGEREERIHSHMRENFRKLGPTVRSIARHEDKLSKKESSPESSKYAIRSKKISEFNRTNPEMKSARKGYNDARAADGLSRKRGAFGIK